MGILALAADERVADVAVTEDELSVRLMDGRTISVPLVWFPRLLRANEAQRKNWRIAGGGYGIHWEEIDEDLSTEGLLRGAPAPRHSMVIVNPAPRQLENRITNGVSEVKNPTAEVFHEGGEKGLLDYLTDGEEAANALTAALSWIDEETVNVGNKLKQHNLHINQLTSRGRKPSELKKIALMAASDMNTFSKMVEAVLPSFEKSVQILEKSFSAYVSYANPESRDDTEQASILRKTLSEMLTVASPAKESMVEFRDSASALGKQNISRDITKAATRQAKAIDGVVRNIEEVESFALRVAFSIEEKFVKPPASKDNAK